MTHPALICFVVAALPVLPLLAAKAVLMGEARDWAPVACALLIPVAAAALALYA